MTLTSARAHLAIALHRAGRAMLSRGYADLARGLIGVDYPTLRAGYVDDITGAMMDYMTGDSAITRFRNAYKRAVLEYFDAAYYVGFSDGGGQISQMSPEDRQWILDRMQIELSYVDSLFASLRALRKELEGASGPEMVAAVLKHAYGYAKSLDAVYSEGKARGGDDDLMLTLLGPDGMESCATCQRLKGQRHPLKWWRERGLIPTQGNRNYDCGVWLCEHRLFDDEGHIFAN